MLLLCYSQDRCRIIAYGRRAFEARWSKLLFDIISDAPGRSFSVFFEGGVLIAVLPWLLELLTSHHCKAGTEHAGVKSAVQTAGVNRVCSHLR